MCFHGMIVNSVRTKIEFLIAGVARGAILFNEWGIHKI